jgi:hypothetical protein
MSCTARKKVSVGSGTEAEASDSEEDTTDEVVNEEPLPVASALPTPTDPVASPEPAAPPTTEVELVPEVLPEDIPEETLGDPAVLGASTTELEPVVHSNSTNTV